MLKKLFIVALLLLSFNLESKELSHNIKDNKIQSYSVNGVKYTRLQKSQLAKGFTQTGLASWYGYEFNQRKTATGAIFNPKALTAAHKTLPLPSIVKVTNLKNHKSVNVLVNDAGPFKKGRIIDLSKQAAKNINLTGVEMVRVDLIKIL